MFLSIFSPHLSRRSTAASLTLALLSATALTSLVHAAPVPGYVAPMTETPVAAYVDDTRGIYVPEHEQLRSKSSSELDGWKESYSEASKPMYAQKAPAGRGYDRALNTIADGVPDTNQELDRIGNERGPLDGGSEPRASLDGAQLAQSKGGDLDQYPSLATGGAGKPHIAPREAAPTMATSAPAASTMAPTAAERNDGGIELAVGGMGATQQVDLQNSVVRLKEERITVRRALQRMLDQVGGGNWAVVWDLDEVNAALPDMEISIYTEEPFIQVLNALLARLQTRSGEPLRVVKYDKTQRLVITDRVGGDAKSAAVGVGGNDAASGAAVTESVLKEATVSLHYDEVPLVDALENLVNQAGKGQWRLRMYAGTDQVLKPAHIEEPFGVAIERVLRVFNLRYEVFPGGKLIVVTGTNRFGFKGVE